MAPPPQVSAPAPPPSSTAAAPAVVSAESTNSQQQKPSSEQKDEDGDVKMKEEDEKDSTKSDDDGDESEEEEADDQHDVTDWYDATVTGYDSDKDIFKVKFVGDDDTVYEMKLSPKIVRPCTQAWLKRSQQVLEGKYDDASPFDFDAWEKQLLVDTATLEDREYLHQKWNKEVSSVSAPGGSDANLAKDRRDIARLCFLVESQIYLRSKLAPSGGESNGASEAYLDHLVKCLKELQQLCVWYEDCYSLYEKVVLTAGDSSSSQSESAQSGSTPLRRPGSSLFNIEYIRGYCLEKGRAMINSLLALDFSRAGSKRRSVPVTVPSHARKTKRRKGYKASGFLEAKGEHQDNDVLFLEEGEFMSLKSVKKFVGKIDQQKWYVGPFLRMLERLCSEIQEPVRLWKRRVDVILGEETEDEDDSSSSEDEDNDKNAADEQKDGEEKEENDEMSTDDDEKERFFTFEDVSSCLDNVRNDRVLAKFDLSQWTNKLREKLTGIESFEADTWRAIPHIVDEVGTYTKDSDQVLVRLQDAKEAATSTNEHVKNVDPLGSGGTRLNRAVIDNAIAVREWILDLQHAEVTRERLSFVQDVVSRAPMLPHVPAPPNRLVDESLTSAMNSRRGQAMSRIQSLSQGLYSHVQVFSRYENIVAEDDSVQLRSKPEVRAALDELRATPVISVVEEKLSIRWDVLKWRDSAKIPLEKMTKSGIKFEILEGLKEKLDAILNGSSSSRSQIVAGLEKNPAIDSDIRQFARREVDAFCVEQAATVDSLYAKGKEWKDRADSIILALRIHGNPSAGPSLSGGQKSAAMVDLKRIDDLLAEYDGLGSTMDERRTRLSSIRDEALSWCSSIEKIVGDDNNVRERLTVARDTRPKGVVMDPARHVVDAWVEALEWHNRLKTALRDLASSSIDGNADAFSTRISDKIYPLMLEGQEVLSFFGQQVPGSFIPDEALGVLSRLAEHNRPTRTISVAKLQSSSLGNTLVSRIVDRDRDSLQGSPLFCLLFLAWRVAVIDLLQLEPTTGEDDDNTSPRRMPTLEEAKQLNALRPRLDLQPHVAMDDGSPPFHQLFSRVETGEVATFSHMINDGDRVEADTRAIVPVTKDIARGAYGKTDEVRNHLTRLRELQSDFKARVQERSGLILDSNLEQSLDSVVKDVTWLVKTFPYAALHSDTVPIIEEPDDEEDEDVSGRSQPQSVPVPWDVLVSLHDRLPDPITGPGGDIARVSLRVEELYEAANAWQQEVTSQMSLSFRGGAKRRSPGTAETDEAPKINMGRLAQLAKHPILARVSMPREAAVRRVLDRAREFEESLAGLLNTDFEGNLADKTPYPDSDSLVGRNGDFLLYRLTGSTLYETLKDTLKKMAEIRKGILADTPGTYVFDWIVKAVAWIDDLESVVEDSDKLAIPNVDAKRLLARGNDLFLEFTDDIRRILAVHKISLSTNKQTERLTVVIGKGGAMHSLGGTAIKWCPLLLEWLKADLERLGDWTAKAVDAAKEFQTMAAKEATSQTPDRETINRWFQLRERVSLVLDEGQESLVIAPQRSNITNLRTLLTGIDTRLVEIQAKAKKSLGLDAETLVKSRFDDGGPAVEDRYSLLDSLTKRRELGEEVAKRQGNVTPQKPTGVSAGPTPRDKARSMLERALRKGAKMMGIDESESGLFCALKACEIEELMFVSFRQELGAKSVTDTYREKLRSMRYNLEDTKNPTLVARVLAGEITVPQLVNMSSEEMASQKLRLKKAKAEEESKKNIILTKPNDPPAGSVKSLLQKSAQPVVPKTSPVARKPVLKTTPPTAAARRSSPTPQTDPKLFGASPSPKQGKPTLKLASLVAQKAIPAPPLESQQQSAAFLPTPPSLAAMTSSSKPSSPPPAPQIAILAPSLPPPSAAATGTSPFVTNSNGTDTFSISVSDSTRRFRVKLKCQDESQRDRVEEVMPELLAEKGRNPIDAFSSFLRGKIETGRWTAIPMKLSTLTEKDATEYKKYLKQYETQKDRISMFAIGKEEKLFLVTPKFHKAAKPLTFESRSSTYAVLLVRSRRFS